MSLISTLKYLFGPIDDEDEGGTDIVDAEVENHDQIMQPFNKEAVLTALGGRDNIVKIESRGCTRVRVELKSEMAKAALELGAEGVKAVAYIKPNLVHLIVGLCAGEYAEALRK